MLAIRNFLISPTLILSMLFAATLKSQPVDILVVTKDKQTAENVGISLTPIDSKVELPKPKSQVMNQINTQFSPHILLAQKGAQISFPNSDSVKHHVYSFSEAKTFEVKLYKDQKPSPLPFEKAGTVTLGCNIHDWMLGYIYVVDTPYFSKTNELGFVQLDAPPGKYELKLHSPLLSEDDTFNVLVVDLSKQRNITVTLQKSLLKNGLDNDDGDEFDAY